ncbi:MAG: hypothetical protein II777_02035, partial [Clostridia bacterium]|nr:hypothetical protein [Clostridia bacterium]
MKKIIAFVLVALFLVGAIAAAIATATHAEGLKDGALLYSCDFENGLPEDFRVVTSDKDRVKVEDGFLILDARGVEFVRVLLPKALDEYGNYEITVHATIINQRDGGRWCSITYRTQDPDGKAYPYYQMCVRHDTTLANGVEFACRTEGNQWSVTAKGPYEKNMTDDGLFEISAYVKGDHAIHSVNGTPVVDCNDAGNYDKGAVGLQANFCVLKVDDIKVTYLSEAPASQTGYVKIAQSDLGVIGGYALSEYVTDNASLDRVTKVKPANAIFYVNSALKLTDAEGKNEFTDLSAALSALNGEIMPTLYIKDDAAVAPVCNYLSKNGISDVFV